MYLKETKTVVGMGEELENIIVIHFILLLRYYPFSVKGAQYISHSVCGFGQA